jgi:hypothetical protein
MSGNTKTSLTLPAKLHLNIKRDALDQQAKSGVATSMNGIIVDILRKHYFKPDDEDSLVIDDDAIEQEIDGVQGESGIGDML